MPAIWGEQYYFLGPVFILLLLLAGTMTFTHVILRKVLGMEKWTGLAAQAVITWQSLCLFIPHRVASTGITAEFITWECTALDC